LALRVLVVLAGLVPALVWWSLFALFAFLFFSFLHQLCLVP